MAEVGYRVLILKSLPEDEEDDPYTTALTRQNIPAVLVPTLEFQFINLDSLHNCLNTPEYFSGLLLVSIRCVQSVVECFNRGLVADNKNKWACLKCYVVGEATARIVEEKLRLRFSGRSSGNFKALLQTIDPNSLDKPLLMPCGNFNKTIPEEKDYSIKKVMVYETRPHSELKSNLEKLKDGADLSLIVFFSPSGVEFAMPFIRDISLSKLQFIAIGPTTNKAMVERNITVSAVCQKPNPEHLVREISEIVQR